MHTYDPQYTPIEYLKKMPDSGGQATEILSKVRLNTLQTAALSKQTLMAAIQWNFQQREQRLVTLLLTYQKDKRYLRFTGTASGSFMIVSWTSPFKILCKWKSFSQQAAAH
jgi:hypothetical protein